MAAREALGARRPPWGDLALAVALLLIGTIEIVMIPDVGGVLASACMVGMTLPIAWRRRAPLAVTVLVTGSLTLMVLGPVPAAIDAAVFPLPALVLALYSLGAHADTARAAVGLGITMAAVFATVFHKGADELLFGAVMGIGPWVAGRIVGRRTEHAVALALHAQELERTQEERQLAAVTQERARIARELHDIIAHSVSVMTVQAGAVEEIIDTDPQKAKAAATSIRQTGRQALVDLRRLLGLLREQDAAADAMVPQPGLGDLDGLLEQVRSAGIDVRLDVAGTPHPLPSAVDLSAYRLVQEALTNTLKHAAATEAVVAVRYLANAVDIEVVDDGGNTGGGGRGHGLIGMQERISLYGGQLEYGRRPSGGFRVHALLPLESDVA